jgi:hypothetical protein
VVKWKEKAILYYTLEEWKDEPIVVSSFFFMVSDLGLEGWDNDDVSMAP